MSTHNDIEERGILVLYLFFFFFFCILSDDDMIMVSLSYMAEDGPHKVNHNKGVTILSHAFITLLEKSHILKVSFLFY